VTLGLWDCQNPVHVYSLTPLLDNKATLRASLQNGKTEYLQVQPDTTPNETQISITKDEVNDLPLRRYSGRVHLISRDADVADAAAEISGEDYLGFDTETRPAFNKGEIYPTALLQLAGAKSVYLFQLQYIDDLDPVFDILENEAVIKAGVAIRDDLRKLQEIRPFEPRSCLEISSFTQRAGIVNTGLRSLAAYYLGFRVSKNAQLSNWSRRRLSSNQITYAATDAWVSRLLYKKLCKLDLLTDSSGAIETVGAAIS